MSSHREAPAISKDPVADNTDVYAFRTPGDTITIIANYLPDENPAGGPNFFEFADDVQYRIDVDNDGDGKPNLSFLFDFTTVIQNPNTFLYNTGPITDLNSPNWNRRQSYKVTQLVTRPGRTDSSSTLGNNLVAPPCNIGPRSTPNYANLANAATYDLGGGVKVFAGQRADPFFVDLGSVFDLGTLRPVQHLHLISMADSNGQDALSASNVHSIAITMPLSMVTRNGTTPTDVNAPESVVGVVASAWRRKGRVLNGNGSVDSSGPYVQVSRLGNPLFNEVIVPMSQKDKFNARSPKDDSQFADFVAHPELAKLLPTLYPGVFPNLKGLNDANAVRDDLLAILLTGIPSGVIPGFQNYTGPTQSDQLRVNLAVPPASFGSFSPYGLLGNDLAGFPNGRRPNDDIVAIELRAVAGATYKLTHPNYTPDAAANGLTDGTLGRTNKGLMFGFPYLGLPYSGFNKPMPANSGAT